MQVNLLVFAHARDQLGWTERAVECGMNDTPRGLFARVAPGLSVAGMRVAVDQEYRDWDTPIGAATEIALIPPVSGG